MLTPNQRAGLLAVVITGGLLLCGGITIGVVAWKARERPEAGSKENGGISSPGLFGPSERSEGSNWTIRELTSYLESKGAVKADGAKYGTPLGMPYASLKSTNGIESIEVFQLDTFQKAKEFAAGRNAPARLSWGRFSISGDGNIVAACKKALGG